MSDATKIFVLILVSYSAITTLINFLLFKAIRRRDGKYNPYFFKVLEKRCESLTEENYQLTKELSAAEGKNQTTESYLDSFVGKHKPSDAAMVSVLNGKFISADGMSKDDKAKQAYQMKLDGYDLDEIAAELGLAVSGVNSYVSRGKKLLNGLKSVTKTESGLHFEYEDGTGKEA